MKFVSNKGMRAVQNWVYRRKDTVPSNAVIMQIWVNPFLFLVMFKSNVSHFIFIFCTTAVHVAQYMKITWETLGYDVAFSASS